MSKRTIGYPRIVLASFVALVAIVFPAIASTKQLPSADSASSASNKGQLKPAQETSYPTRSEEVMQRQSAETDGAQADSIKHVPLFDREVPFWPYSQGPEYGTLSPDLAIGPDVIHLQVGDLDTRSHFGMPVELTNADTEMAVGERRYFLIQFRPQLMSVNESARSLKLIQDTGAKLVEYVPNNAYIVQADRSSIQLLRASSVLQYVGPFHTAYKLDSRIGRMPTTDSARAASDAYTVVVVPFPGEWNSVRDQITALLAE